jgi:hypothetical protein
MKLALSMRYQGLRGFSIGCLPLQYKGILTPLRNAHKSKLKKRSKNPGTFFSQVSHMATAGKPPNTVRSK